jgi:hypothetical protein
MSLFRWINCDVHCNRFSNFPEAILLLAGAITRKNQKCTERTGNKPESAKSRGRYKTSEEDRNTG